MSPCNPIFRLAIVDMAARPSRQTQALASERLCVRTDSGPRNKVTIAVKAESSVSRLLRATAQLSVKLHDSQMTAYRGLDRNICSFVVISAHS